MPTSLAGPFIWNPAVIAKLDEVDPKGCVASGPLVFGCLIQGQLPEGEQQALDDARANPFNLDVARIIRATVDSDLEEYRESDEANDFPDGDPNVLKPSFLTGRYSRIELVGVVNRMDRSFIRNDLDGVEQHDSCGEISVIYRFSYQRYGETVSRLPVTMNVVFPAVPVEVTAGAQTCQDVAKRWRHELEADPNRNAEEVVTDLMDPETGVLSIVAGQAIRRIELNMQAYRIKVSGDTTDLGSTARYIIRVFRWDPKEKVFLPSVLLNQIDRARLLGDLDGDANSCDPGTKKVISRQKLVDYLTSPAVLGDIDYGTLNIPQEFLACRAVSVSPGGGARSGNQPFWNSPEPSAQIITDKAMADAMIAYESDPKTQFSFMKSVEDMRTRLNESTCSGCHQSRAIAGFHFPGADRVGAPSANSVFLPGSPQFYADQPRRLEILQKRALGETVAQYDLASGYASRPLNRFQTELAGTELLGGWGGACVMPGALGETQRQWTCQPDLECRVLFESPNAPDIGTCVPKEGFEIGDAMQAGTVTTKRFGVDKYARTDPAKVATVGGNRQTLLKVPDELSDPQGNSYYVAHQEWFAGSPDVAVTDIKTARVKRDSQTGGFPAGMLRLSECVGLPDEATCGLVASPGFADCIENVGETETLESCFAKRTAYAGLRACDATSPCRDDYICLSPLGYSLANGKERYETRAARVAGLQDPNLEFGQKMPDSDWLGRNGGTGDPRGVCIPPYFVMQFRVDNHPTPKGTGLAP